MQMPPEILTHLLKGGHLSVEERKKLGLWPNETLRFDDIVGHLARILENEEWFPRKLLEHKVGDPVKEGIFIQRQAKNKFACYAQRSSIQDVNIVAERTETVFSSAKDAAAFYLKWELRLPGRLDSWPVI
jgi:hypothetical protein